MRPLPQRGQQAAKLKAEPVKKKAFPPPVFFPPSPVLGRGLGGLGYGQLLSPGPALNLESLRGNESLRQLPVSAEVKALLASGNSWHPLGEGWYLGPWKLVQPRKAPSDEQIRQQFAIKLRQTQDGAAAELEDEEEVKEEEPTAESDSNAMADRATVTDELTEEMQEREPDGDREEAETEPQAVEQAEQQEEELMQEDEQSAAGGGSRRRPPPRLTAKKAVGQCWACHGFGYLVDRHGVQLVGHFDRGALYDDSGIIIDSAGVYHGQVVHNLETGNGAHYYRSNGDVATGRWLQGHLQLGSILYGDGNALYTGAFASNQPSGLGITDYFEPAPPTFVLQYRGSYERANWTGVGTVVCNDRTLTADWEQERTRAGTAGLIEWEDDEGMLVRYVGDIREYRGEGLGRMSWRSVGAEERKAIDRHEQLRIAGRDRRRTEHQQRQAGEWSSLAAVVRLLRTLEPAVAGMAETLASLPSLQWTADTPGSSVYTGEVSGGVQHGYGVREWQNGDRYSGNWEGGICHGFGHWRSTDRNDELGTILYSGGWRQDKEHGRGALISSMPSLGRMVFHGRFVDGWLSGGLGSVYFLGSGRLYYVGRMLKGAFDGPGVMRLDDGSLYVGRFVNGELRGRGCWTDTREASVYTGRFKFDYKHGCGRLIIHEKLPEKQNPAAIAEEADNGAGPALPSSPSQQSSSLGDSSLNSSASGGAGAEDGETADAALSRCQHRIELPMSLGAATHSYLAVYERDRPVLRLVSRALDDLLEEIGYGQDEDDSEVNALVREEQLDTAREGKKKVRQQRKSSSAAAPASLAVSPPSRQATDGAGDEDAGSKAEKDGDSSAPADSDDGLALLHSYQLQLDRLTKKGKKDKQPGSAAASLQELQQGSLHAQASLRLPPPPLSLFESPAVSASSSLRRVLLPRAISLCAQHKICSFAVTGHLPADRCLMYCMTCSSGGPGADEDEERRVEVCAACRAAGCHRGHELRRIDVVERGSEHDDTKGEAAVFYCNCGLMRGKCHTAMEEFRDSMDCTAAPGWEDRGRGSQHGSRQQAVWPDQPQAAGLQRQAMAAVSELLDGGELEKLKDGGKAAAEDDSFVELSEKASPAVSLLPSQVRARNAAEAGSLWSSRSLLSSLSSASTVAPLPSQQSVAGMLSSSRSSRKPTIKWVKVNGRWVEETPPAAAAPVTQTAAAVATAHNSAELQHERPTGDNDLLILPQQADSAVCIPAQ